MPVGLSNHNVAQLEEAEAVGHVDSLQPPFSAVKRGTAAEIAWCAAHSTGVIIYSPMQAGLLTGAFSADRVASLHQDDWRKRDPQFQGDNLERNLALAEKLRQIGERRSVGPGVVAIARALEWPGVSGAIVGGRSPRPGRRLAAGGHPKIDRGGAKGGLAGDRIDRGRIWAVPGASITVSVGSGDLPPASSMDMPAQAGRLGAICHSRRGSGDFPSVRRWICPPKQAVSVQFATLGVFDA